MMRYMFWHGRTNRKSDLAWLQNAEQSLLNNTWRTPLYVDGAGWEHSDRELRQEAATRLFKALGHNTSALTLIFQNARLDVHVEQAFSQAMDSNMHLKSLTLRNLSRSDDNNDNANNGYEIPASVFLNPHLESLTLVKAFLNFQACHNLSTMIRESDSLTTLSLESVVMDRQGMMSVLAAVIMSRSLVTLKLVNLEWSKQDIKRFLLAATFNRTIRRLHLEGMRLDVTDAPALVQLLQRNKTIQQLSLRKNFLTADALEIMVPQGFCKNDSLQKLFLSRNILGDASAPMLCRLLKHCSNLQELCLVDTKMMKTGCVAIAHALRDNHTLISLSMDGNYFEACGSEMVQALQHNMQLQHCLDRLPAVLARKQGDYQAWRQVDLLLRANCAHRQYLRLEEGELPRQLLPFIWEGTSLDTDVLNYFLRNCNAHHLPRPDPHRDHCAPPRRFVPSNKKTCPTVVSILSASSQEVSDSAAPTQSRPSTAPSA